MKLFEEAKSPVAVGSPLDGLVVQRIREMLRTEFERTSHALSALDDAVRDLEAAAGVHSALVMPILKHDLATGRVVRGRDHEGRRTYMLNSRFDGLQADAMAAAAALLRRHGFEVRPR